MANDIITAGVISVDTDSFGNTYYKKDGKYHRTDGPAVIQRNGYQEWWENGVLKSRKRPDVEEIQLHRIEYKDKIEYYGNNSQRHRLDGPAVKYKNKKYEEWWKDGKKHRNGDEPAIILKDLKEWYVDGKLHRETDKPSHISKDTETWCVKGKISRLNRPAQILYFSKDHESFFKKEYFKFLNENENIYTKIERWLIDDKSHRLNGPTDIIYNGKNKILEMWKQNGKFHRENGPAILSKKTRQWRLNGVLHRIGGPALEEENKREYWVNGERIEEVSDIGRLDEID